MTRKHFQAIAITIGCQMRKHEVGSTEWNAIYETAAMMCADFRAANSAFQPTTFLTFVLDVANYRRGLDGKVRAA